MKLVTAMTIAVMWLASATAAHAATVLHHVHGLAFTPDGKALMVPAHIGLAVYQDGRWSTAPGAPHDFMGFSISKNAIYTSGHPAPSSPLKNPLGLMKSTDRGASWQKLGLSGESDFHLMAASYASNAIYVLNPEPNSRMPQGGIHGTENEGKSWTRAAGSGLSGQITSLSAHPTSAATVAVGTVNGVHVSRDRGATFKRIGPSSVVTAVTFDFDGKHVYFATDAADKLRRIALDSGELTALSLPTFERDFVTYIAQNPRDVKTLAIATRQRDVYLSRDAGNTWQQIARNGESASVTRSARK